MVYNDVHKKKRKNNKDFTCGSQCINYWQMAEDQYKAI